jgi:glycosyltransferase involved in cell wall biosynthesis
MRKAKVSIIIPTYNRPKFLREAVDSALKQDYENKEIIIVDDGSDDGLLSAVGFAIDNNPEISFFSKGNGGVASAMNMGIEYSSGDLITILQDDDLYYDKKAISNMVKLFKKNIEVVWTSVCEFKDDGWHHIVPAPPVNVYDVWKEDIINLDVMMWRRSIHDKIGYFSEDLLSNEDWEFEIKCVMECCCYSEDILTHQYRRHDGNKSTVNKDKMKNYERTFKERLRERYKNMVEVIG